MPRVSRTILGNMPIPLPPLAEQQRIADYLDAKCAHIDQCLELSRQSMEKLRAYKLSCITEAVTKGLDPDVPLKDSGVPWIGQIPAGWKITRLKFIAPMQCGYAFKSENFLIENGIPLVRMSNLKRGEIDLTDSVKINYSNTIEEFLIFEHDILLGLSGSIGETGSLGNYAIAKKENLPCLLNQRVGRFRISSQIRYELLIYFLATDFFKKPLELEATGTAQFNISPTAIGNIFVPLPPSPNRSASPYLDKKCARIDALLEEKQALLDKLAEYKKSLIFECVTGKREVPSCWNR